MTQIAHTCFIWTWELLHWEFCCFPDWWVSSTTRVITMSNIWHESVLYMAKINNFRGFARTVSEPTHLTFWNSWKSLTVKGRFQYFTSKPLKRRLVSRLAEPQSNIFCAAKTLAIVDFVILFVTVSLIFMPFIYAFFLSLPYLVYLALEFINEKKKCLILFGGVIIILKEICVAIGLVIVYDYKDSNNTM